MSLSDGDCEKRFVARGGMLYDLSFLENYSRGDDLFVKEMLEMFVLETPIILQTMQRHATERKWEEVRRAAHKFSPHLTYFGLLDIKNLVSELEVRILPLVNSNKCLSAKSVEIVDGLSKDVENKEVVCLISEEINNLLEKIVSLCEEVICGMKSDIDLKTRG